MKKHVLLLAVLGVIGYGSLAQASMTQDSQMPQIQEHLVFSLDKNQNMSNTTPPADAILSMTHKEGTKTRDFSLAKNGDYAEMKSLTRQHLSGGDRIGGFFVDELISKDGKYILILAGQVHESQKNGQAVYTKHGTWMDSEGRTGTWIDQVQAQMPHEPQAACGGK